MKQGEVETRGNTVEEARKEDRSRSRSRNKAATTNQTDFSYVSSVKTNTGTWRCLTDCPSTVLGPS